MACGVIACLHQLSFLYDFGRGSKADRERTRTKILYLRLLARVHMRESTTLSLQGLLLPLDSDQVIIAKQRGNIPPDDVVCEEG
jgi:hypothetical protein